jgi:integrase/recombinase XerD
LQRLDLERFVRDLMAEGRSPRSVAREVACVRGFYRFLVIDGRLPASPADDLHPPRAWQVLPKYLSVDDVDSLIAQPDVSTPRGLARFARSSSSSTPPGSGCRSSSGCGRPT